MAGQKKYRRIRGLGGIVIASSLSTNHTLWLGDNHLLSVKSRPFWEDYRRFYYKDIQSVICRKTHMGKVINALFGLFVGLGLLAIHYETGTVFWWIWAGANSLFILLNISMGPTCVCHIQTAAQVEKLPRLVRIKKVDRFLAVLKPLIEKAQGGTWDRTAAETSRNSGQTLPGETDSSMRHEPGTLHLGLFLMLLIFAGLIVIDLFWDHPGIILAAAALTVIIALLNIVCLVKQYQSNIDHTLQKLVWGNLVFVGFLVTAGFFYSLFMAVGMTMGRKNYWALAELYSRNSPGDVVWLQYCYIISIAVVLTLSLLGLVMSWKHRRISAGGNQE